MKFGPVRISFGVEKPVAKLDLTLREVEEAKEYGLSPDQYDDFRSKLEERLKRKLMPEAEKVKAEYVDMVRKEVRKDLQPKIREEVLAECRKQAEKELWDKLWKDALEQVSNRAPTPKEREAFKDFVREVELDCLTQAEAASGDSERALLAYRWTRRLRFPIAWGLFLALPVLAFALHQHFGWGFWTFAFLIPALIGAGGFAYHTNDQDDKLQKQPARLGKIASDYWVLAERAKKLRMVTAHTALNRGELQTTLQTYTDDKKRLDDEYLPSAKALEKSRAHVRVQLLNEVDPLGSKAEEFEALEEQAQAQAEQKAS